MKSLAEHEKDPAFQRRAAVLEPSMRAQVRLGRDIDLGDVARELEVPLDVAGAWVAVLVTGMGKPFKLTLTGLPQ